MAKYSEPDTAYEGPIERTIFNTVETDADTSIGEQPIALNGQANNTEDQITELYEETVAKMTANRTAYREEVFKEIYDNLGH